MKKSRLGRHYRELIRHRNVLRQFVKTSNKYKKDLYNILGQILNLERQHNVVHHLKIEVIQELNQVCEDIEYFTEEDQHLTYNLSRLPLG